MSQNRSSSRARGTNSSLAEYKADAELLGLTGKDLAEYVERRRQEEIDREEKRRQEEINREEKRRQEEIDREERERQAEIEKEKLRLDFELRQFQLQNENINNVNGNNSNVHVCSKDSLPRLPFLEDKDDVEHYIKQFERVARLS